MDRPNPTEVAQLVVAITGAGSGIGAALAECFRADGAKVTACDVAAGVDRCRDVADHAAEADVTDRDALDVWLAGAVDQLGRIDVLIANAGIGRRASLIDGDWADTEATLRINLFGVLHSVRAAIPHLRAGGGGRLIALASRNAEFCQALLGGYNASKAGVITAMRTISRELRMEAHPSDAHILANCLIPGPIASGMNTEGQREPASAYPTARLLATLPDDGPNGRTYFDGEDYPVWAKFS